MADEAQEQTEVSKIVEITQEEKDQEKKIRKEIESYSFISRRWMNESKVRISTKLNKFVSEH